MKVYTYFQTIFKNSHLEWLIDIWTETWSKHGWEPVILTKEDIVTHPLYKQMDTKTDLLPCVSKRIFEKTCYMRWLPMSMLGGVMVDYDVLNFGFTPKDIIVTNYITNYSTKGHSIGIFDATCCGYSDMVDLILKWPLSEYQLKDEKPHISDALMFIKKLINNNAIPTIPVCKLYGPSTDAKLIHFAGFACRKYGLERVDAIRQTLKPNG